MLDLVTTVQDVRCVNCRPDLLEGIAAFAGVIGGVAAVIAVFMARASAGAAERSAVAAERTAKAAEDEAALTREQVEAWRAERSRQAVITVDVGLTGSSALAPHP